MQRKIKTDKKHLATLSHDLNALTSQYDFLMLKSVKGQTGKQTKSHMGQQIEILEHLMRGHSRRLNQLLRNNLFQTIQSVTKVVKERNISGVFGILIDLIEIPEKLRMPCDVALGNQLFSFVVRDEKVAKQLLEINRELGGASFAVYPLNWQKMESSPNVFGKMWMEEGEEDGALKMRDIVKLVKGPGGPDPKKMEGIIQAVFGRLLFVRNLNMAMTFSRGPNGFNCVTGKGEIVYAGSFLTKLGFYDVRKEKISVYEAWKMKYIEQLTFDQKIDALQEEQDDLANLVLKHNQQLQQLIQKKNKNTIQLR